MRLDHLSFAAGPDGIAASTARLEEQFGVSFGDGGLHPRFGTRNRTLSLQDGRYVEVVEVLDHPAADKAPFGQAVRARSEAGGGWLGWVLAVEDMAPYENRLGREAVIGTRVLPDGSRLEWKQLGVKGLQADPQLPFFVQWAVGGERHPSAHPGRVRLQRLEIAGDPARVREWIGGDVDEIVDDLEVSWIAPNGNPGLVAAVFEGPNGEVRI